ncbi:MAG: TetR/AcrR family transcriptional regulator [Candidatus Marinimicrobia bacterium]|nr:TetR/AcrR family transcriptional regulator [Candidatus Neomarinimicrobiota bacterium]
MNNNSNSDTLSRKDRERQRHRHEIIEAAVHLFARNGFNETKLEDVAALAEFGKGTIYNYFENKGDLLLSSIKFAIEDAQRYLQDQLRDVDDVIERLSLIVIAQFDYYDQNEDYMRLMVSQHRNIVQEMTHMNNSGLYKEKLKLSNMLVKEFQRAIDTNRIKPGSAKSYTNYLLGMIHGQVRGLSSGEIEKDEINPKEIVDIFLYGASHA